MRKNLTVFTFDQAIFSIGVPLEILVYAIQIEFSTLFFNLCYRTLLIHNILSKLHC